MRSVFCYNKQIIPNPIEKYPYRVMIGTDKVGHWETYPSEVVKYYKLLDRLDDETVKKITCENALSLVKKH